MINSVNEPDPKNHFLSWFCQRFPFELDEFQLEAIRALVADRSVLVALPTGSGKTIVAHFAIDLALSRQKKAIYTAPLKALSNQKYGEFVASYGRDQVGLLTGDVSVNPRASVVVMTTEILRNMLYANDPSIAEVSHVILDEIHYLQDPERGSVWEEVILLLPKRVKLVCLSATISNTREFLSWLRSIRGEFECVAHTKRPVPLEILYCYGSPRSNEASIKPLFKSGTRKPNPQLTRVLDRYRFGRPRYDLVPHRLDVIEALERKDLLPAIYFIFSRAGCMRALRTAMSQGVSLVSATESEEVERHLLSKVARLSDADLVAIGFGELWEGARRGIAVHHAGMIHPLKEAVEQLFEKGLIRVVFATETLSLGIDMPARAVVIESLYKFDGVSHKLLTPAEFTQLAGRAGRRGKDERGYVVVVHSPWVTLDHVASVAHSTRFHLVSSFKPGYNMVVNMIARYGDRQEAYRVLRQSFAAYQAGEPSPDGRRNERVVGGKPKALTRRGKKGSWQVIREFERYLEVLELRGFVKDGWTLTDKGRALQPVFCERDVAAVEWAMEAFPEGLTTPEYAALLSGWASEGLSEEAPLRPAPRSQWPWSEAFSQVESVVADLRSCEQEVFGVGKTPLPDFQMAQRVACWCKKANPEELFAGARDPGDVLRHVRRVIDIARQLYEAVGRQELLACAQQLDVGIVASAVPGAEAEQARVGASG